MITSDPSTPTRANESEPDDGRTNDHRGSSADERAAIEAPEASCTGARTGHVATVATQPSRGHR